MLVDGVYSINIEEETLKNEDYRRVLFTTDHQQIVVMNLKPGEDIPLEVHPHNAQFIRVEKGYGQAMIGENKEKIINLYDGIIVDIPAGTYHYFKNTSNSQDLKLYLIYSPPEHPPNRIDRRQPKDQDGGKNNDERFKEKYFKYKYKYNLLRKKLFD